MVSLSLEQANSQKTSYGIYQIMCHYRHAADKEKKKLINTSFVCYLDYADSILLLGLHSVHTLLHKATVQ